ncbi:alkaline phosphatase family protein [Nitrospira sp. Ecomares 2.1]
MEKAQKVVLLGIDAGSRDLLKRWAQDGTLPTLQALFAKSLVGATTSTPGLFVGSTWPTWYTGVNPGKHGIHSLHQLQPGTYELHPTYAGESVKREPFWNHLSRAGRRVAILDIPLTALSHNLNGIQLVEYGAHDAHSGFMTWPPSLAAEVEQRFGSPCSHPIQGDCDAKRDAAGVAAFRDTLINGVARKTAVTKHFLQQDNWDLFAQVFTESHCIGHQYWHVHDPTHQWHDADLARIVGDPIKDVYKAIDTAIGEILKDIDEETTVIVFVSHGMGQTNIPYGFMEKFLLQLKVAVPPRIPANNVTGSLLQRRSLAFLYRMWQKIPSSVQKFLAPIIYPLSHKLSADSGPLVDRAASKCFSIHDTPSHAGIRVNLVGREPEGKVQPGPDYQQFCMELEKDLLGIINVKTGKPVIQRIIRTADHYSGENLAHLPDLLVEWYEEDPIPAVFSEKFGKISTNFWHPRTGHHRAGGMFLAFGPSIQPGTVDRTVSLMDYAPTIAQLLNVSLPDVDGQPIEELLMPIPTPQASSRRDA